MVLGPLDLDRQCGVPTDNGPCTRSITCKKHNVSAKRNVQGRSQQYDTLLQEYQAGKNKPLSEYAGDADGVNLCVVELSRC